MPPINKKKQEQLTEELKEIRKSNKENLVCADCPNRAPSYVCLNFSTFVCTECSGLHRKFGHRVKSIAVATFTEEEVEKMRQGGNEVANSHYLGRYKKGQDTFILPREGERDRMEQYLSFKYVDKKWYKETLKPKEKKTKKSENKTDGDDTGDVEEETVTTTSSKTKRSSATGVSTSKQVIQQPSPDLLSFDETSTSNTTKEDTTKKNAPVQDELFDNSGWDDGSNTKQPDDWGGDDLWGDNSDTFNTTSTSKGTSVNLSSLYQSTNPQSMNVYSLTNQGYTGTTMNVPMNVGGNMGMWGQPMNNVSQVPITNQSSTSTSQGSSFLDALSTVNQQQKQLEDDKKKKEEEARKASSKQTTQTKEEPKEDDPFASLMDSSGLSTKSDSTITTTTTQPGRRTSGTSYNLNTGMGMSGPSMMQGTYGNPSSMTGSNMYYPNPNAPIPNTMMPNMMMTTNMMAPNMYMTGGPQMYGVGGGVYGNPNSTQQIPNQYTWNSNPSYGGSNDTDNPFR